MKSNRVTMHSQTGYHDNGLPAWPYAKSVVSHAHLLQSLEAVVMVSLIQQRFCQRQPRRQVQLPVAFDLHNTVYQATQASNVRVAVLATSEVCEAGVGIAASAAPPHICTMSRRTTV